MTAILAAILGFFAYPVVMCLFGLLLSVLYITAVEHKDDDWEGIHGFTVFLTIVAAAVYYKYIFAFFANWQLALLCLAAYGIIGGGWSIFRWFRFCKKYIETHPAKNNVDNWKWQGNERVNFTPEEFALAAENHYKEQLKPSKYKSRLISWIVYWPWSMFWNVLGDFFTSIYDALVNVYNRVAAAVIKKALRG